MAAFKGGSGVPDTGSPSVRVTSHTSFRPINSLAGKKEGGAGRDRKVKNGHKDEGQKALWMSKETDYRGREGGVAEARRRRAAYLCPSSPRDGPGVNEGVKYSAEGLERRTLSDVKQLQRWAATPGTEPLLKNAIPPPALIFI